MDDVTEYVLPTYETVLLSIEGGGPVATVTLNRPDVLNALNAQLFRDLETVFTLLTANAAVRAIVITGAGPKAFAAGADIAELSQIGTKADAASGEQVALRGQAVFRKIETCGKPVVAAVNGFALGGGCELAMACTMRIASDAARFGQPEIKLGLIPGYGGTQRLPRLIGRAAALKLILTGEIVPAAEALRIGLVEEVVPAAGLLARARALASSIAALAPLAVTAAMEVVDAGEGLPLEQALALEAAAFGRLSNSADKHEGVAAFLEKRAATFTGH